MADSFDSIKELLCDQFGITDEDLSETVIFENPSYVSAIIGITDDYRIVYDFQKMVESLMEEDGISAEEALEFIDYNTMRSLPYAGSMGPVIVHMLE